MPTEMILKKGDKILTLEEGKIYLKIFISYNRPKTSMHYAPTVTIKANCDGAGDVDIIPDKIIYGIKEDGELTKNIDFE